jgi:hypothetical protein
VGWLAAWGGAGLGARGNGALHLLDKPRGEPQDLAPVGKPATSARRSGCGLAASCSTWRSMAPINASSPWARAFSWHVSAVGVGAVPVARMSASLSLFYQYCLVRTINKHTYRLIRRGLMALT